MKAGTPSATPSGALRAACPYGHPRYPFTRSKGCNTCKAQVIAARRKREREHAQKVAGIAQAIKGTVDPGHIHVPRART